MTIHIDPNADIIQQLNDLSGIITTRNVTSYGSRFSSIGKWKNKLVVGYTVSYRTLLLSRVQDWK